MHFTNVRIEVHHLLVEWNKLLLKSNEVLTFQWPIEDIYASWKTTYPSHVTNEGETSTEEAPDGSAQTP